VTDVMLTGERVRAPTGIIVINESFLMGFHAVSERSSENLTEVIVS